MRFVKIVYVIQHVYVIHYLKEINSCYFWTFNLRHEIIQKPLICKYFNYHSSVIICLSLNILLLQVSGFQRMWNSEGFKRTAEKNMAKNVSAQCYHLKNSAKGVTRLCKADSKDPSLLLSEMPSILKKY